MLSLIGLVILLMSDRLRQRIQRLVSRHLRRPVHDYRAIWTTFAERTGAILKREDLCREVARVLVCPIYSHVARSGWSERRRNVRHRDRIDASHDVTRDRVPAEGDRMRRRIGGPCRLLDSAEQRIAFDLDRRRSRDKQVA